jgi:hypothetical protein
MDHLLARGLMHPFRNAGPGPAQLLEVIAPAGFEKYFVELAEAGDPSRRQELAAKYGVTYSDEWVAELTSRYNLKLLGDQDARCGATRVGALWSRQPA